MAENTMAIRATDWALTWLARDALRLASHVSLCSQVDGERAGRSRRAQKY